MACGRHALTLRVLLVLVNIHYEMADLPHAGVGGHLPGFGAAVRVGRQPGLGHDMHGWLQYQRNELAAADRVFAHSPACRP